MPASFIAFHDIPEAEAPAGIAPTFAVVLARGPGGVVLVFNRYRGVWELPGGMIDPGESAREAARRELAEEAHCDAGSLDWFGVVEVDDGRRRRGAVFGCIVESVPAQVRNEEVDGIAAWTRQAAPQPLGPADRILLESLSERLARTGPPKTG